MSRVLRVAATETKNAFGDMPERIEDLPRLAGRMDEIRDANLAHHEALARQAAAIGVRAMSFGELFTAPYFATVEDPMWLGLAEDALTGPTATRLAKLAAELRMVLVAPLFEHDATNGRRYNTAVVIDADGRVLGRYRKTHIPHGANEKNQFRERFYYGAADDSLTPYFPVFETKVGRVGVAICYDRHFEGVMRSLVAGGAELIFSPAITFGDKSEHFWEREFEVDAMRHRVFIVGSNRLGVEPPFGVHYFGRSHVAGPDGRVPSQRDLPNMIWADVDLDVISSTDGSGWNLVRDRRPDIYTA